MIKKTMVATIRTGLNIYHGVGFSGGKVEGNFAYEFELCGEADKESCSSQGNDSPEGVQNCDST